MTTTRILTATLLIGASALLATSCGSGESYGTVDADALDASVAQLLGAPGDFTAKTVRVEGRIARECPAGCWLEVEQDGNSIHVDLAGAGLAIPQHVGKEVVIIGTVEQNGPAVALNGKGVTIR